MRGKPSLLKVLNTIDWIAIGVTAFGLGRENWPLAWFGFACLMGSIGVFFWLRQRDPEGDALPPRPAIANRFHMTDRASAAVARAEAVAKARGEDSPQALDLLIALADEDGGVAHAVLENVGLANPGLRERLAREGANRQTTETQSEPDLNELLEIATKECEPLGHKYIGTEHLLLALAQWPPASDVAQVFAKAGIDPQALRNEVRLIIGHPVETP